MPLDKITVNSMAANSVNTTAVANSSITPVKLSEPNALEDLFLLGISG